MIIRDTLNKWLDPKLIICACHNDEHQIIFYPDEEEQIIYQKLAEILQFGCPEALVPLYLSLIHI